MMTPDESEVVVEPGACGYFHPRQSTIVSDGEIEVERFSRLHDGRPQAAVRLFSPYRVFTAAARDRLRLIGQRIGCGFELGERGAWFHRVPVSLAAQLADALMRAVR